MNIKQKFSKVIFLGAVFFSIQAWAGGTVIRVNGHDSGKVVNLAIGDAVEVYLESNPTTGYQWIVEQLDQAVLKQVKFGFTTASGAVGGDHDEVMRFEALKKAQTLLRLVYRRSFEKDVPPIKSFNLSIVIKSN